MRIPIKHLVVLAGVAVLLVLGLSNVAGAGAHPGTHPAGLVGSVRSCGGPRGVEVHACRPMERNGRVEVRSHGELVTVAQMHHGRFSILLHPGRYGVVVVLGHGSDHSRPRLVRVVPHRTTHVIVTFQVK